jgi:hypothetical protein
MRFKPLLIPLFLVPTSTLALPNTANDAIPYDIVNLTAPKTSNDLSANDVLSWKAKGGCKVDWNRRGKCFKQCSSEAATICGTFLELRSQIQGGCWLFWRTCRCSCVFEPEKPWEEERE